MAITHSSTVSPAKRPPSIPIYCHVTVVIFCATANSCNNPRFCHAQLLLPDPTLSTPFAAAKFRVSYSFLQPGLLSFWGPAVQPAAAAAANFCSCYLCREPALAEDY